MIGGRRLTSAVTAVCATVSLSYIAYTALLYLTPRSFDFDVQFETASPPIRNVNVTPFIGFNERPPEGEVPSQPPTKNTGLSACPERPPALVGPLLVELKNRSETDVITEMNLNVNKSVTALPGGHFKPISCLSRNKVAIIIPYRNREAHLRGFLYHYHPIFQRQQLDYIVVVVEQDDNNRFNRALLMNIGYAEAIKFYDWECFIFSDVDLLIENDYNLYSCPDMPRHMSGYIDKFNYKIPYGSIFGGVSALSRQHFELVNGFSNMYFGWGGEDDDIRSRITYHHLKVVRYDPSVSHMKMWRHLNEKGNVANPQRMTLLNKATSRILYDGINSLKYTLVSTNFTQTHFHIKVTFSESEVNAAVFAKKEQIGN